MPFLSATRVATLALAIGIWNASSLQHQQPLTGATGNGTTRVSPTLALPSFAGAWQLQNLREGPYSPFGSWFTATQTDTALVVTPHVLVVMDDYPGTPATLTTEEEGKAITIKLIGETRETFAEPPPSAGSLFDAPMEIPISALTRSNWAGDQLVVVIHTSSKIINVPGAASYASERTDRMTLNRDRDGRLIVDVLTIEDPFPGVLNVRETPPSIRSTVYYPKR